MFSLIQREKEKNGHEDGKVWALGCNFDNLVMVAGVRCILCLFLEYYEFCM